jgi:hypothetical protein
MNVSFDYNNADKENVYSYDISIPPNVARGRTSATLKLAVLGSFIKDAKQ